MAPGAPAMDLERIAALEQAAQSLQDKIRGLESRLQKVETIPPAVSSVTSPTPAPAGVPIPQRLPPTEVTWDAEAVKKNLLAKMWKYLNDDERPSKAV